MKTIEEFTIADMSFSIVHDCSIERYILDICIPIKDAFSTTKNRMLTIISDNKTLWKIINGNLFYSVIVEKANLMNNNSVSPFQCALPIFDEFDRVALIELFCQCELLSQQMEIIG